MTDLEQQIINLHNQHKKNREIARELSVHHNTVAYWLKKK